MSPTSISFPGFPTWNRSTSFAPKECCVRVSTSACTDGCLGLRTCRNLGFGNRDSQTADALPLASQPTAAAFDLVLEAVVSDFTRDALVSLLRSPHLVFFDEGCEVTREMTSAFNRALSDARYLGGLEKLEGLEGADSREGRKGQDGRDWSAC